MTAQNNYAGDASDALLRATGAASQPSGWTGRELRREKARNARKARKRGEPAQPCYGFTVPPQHTNAC